MPQVATVEGGRGPLLSVREVTKRFGGVVALDALSFTIDEGQICGLIGPNGAGKTSLFNVVSRLYVPDRGRIEFAGIGPARRPGPRHRQGRAWPGPSRTWLSSRPSRSSTT